MSSKKILIVDDSPTERQFLSELLSKNGFEVTTADDGEDGVAKSQSVSPDLIVMDVVMPGLNGFQATKQISTHDSTKHIPIIMCTTKDQETDKVWAVRQGAKDYVTKPVDESELLSKIRQYAS